MKRNLLKRLEIIFILAGLAALVLNGSAQQFPTITSQPTNLSVAVGANATFSVTATGTPPPSYQWLFNTANLTDGGRIGGTTTSALTISNSQISDVGSYSVVVSNSSGAATSSNAVLTILHIPDGLIHRYSFTTDARDSIGNADGTLVDGASIADGLARFNGTSNYVSLPGGLLNGLSSVTIEFWASFGTNGDWARVFDFGDRSGANGIAYVFFTPHSSFQDHRLVISSNVNSGLEHEEMVSVSGVLDGQTNFHVACVYDEPKGVLALYTNGVLERAGTLTIPLNSVSNVVSWLGRSLYSADAYLNGSIDEFRIYQVALSGSQISASFAAGPDSLSRPVIVAQAQSQTVILGSDVTFKVTARGSEPLSYQWRVNGADVEGATGVTLVVTNVQVSQSGNVYSLVVSNAVGAVTSADARLTVLHSDDALIHRYSFTLDARDSVGLADGTLVNSATIANGTVMFDGTSNHVSLPGGLLNGLSSVTIEFWASFGANADWARVFDFGDRSGINGIAYVFFTPHSSYQDHRLVISSDADPGWEHEEMVSVSGVLDGKTISTSPVCMTGRTECWRFTQTECWSAPAHSRFR